MLPYLEDIAKDQDIAVRIRAVQLLVDVIEGSDSQKVCDVLNIIEKVCQYTTRFFFWCMEIYDCPSSVWK